MEIVPVTEKKKRLLPLLLLADEQEDMIDRYLDRGTMYVLTDPETVAVCVVTDEGGGVLEDPGAAAARVRPGNDPVFAGAIPGRLSHHAGWHRRRSIDSEFLPELRLSSLSPAGKLFYPVLRPPNLGGWEAAGGHDCAEDGPSGRAVRKEGRLAAGQNLLRVIYMNIRKDPLFSGGCDAAHIGSEALHRLRKRRIA